jgi:protein gp37
MADKSKIEWTDATWNPIRGCSRVSDGCRNCYAEKVANRFKGKGMPYEGLIAKSGAWNGNIKFVHHLMDQPTRWKKPRRIFVNSMSDLFHENVPVETIAEIFGIMARCPQHTFQVLTKRPERMHQLLNSFGFEVWVRDCIKYEPQAEIMQWPLPNVWLGVSAEDQQTANERIPLLLDTRAAVRWVSAEPLLGEIDLNRIILKESIGKPPISISALRGWYGGWLDAEGNPAKLDWVVVGGESGKGARLIDSDWVRLMRDQCASVETPFFFKQWGQFAPLKASKTELEWMQHFESKKAAGRELDGITHDEFPQCHGY